MFGNPPYPTVAPDNPLVTASAVAPAGTLCSSPVVSNGFLWRNWVVLSLKRPNDVFFLSGAWLYVVRPPQYFFPA
jgi:hypothetical protein